MYKLYNGCPNDELQALWDSRDKARERLNKVCMEVREVGAFITYFPLEQKYAASDKSYKSIGDFEHTVEQCADKAIEILKNEQK